MSGKRSVTYSLAIICSVLWLGAVLWLVISDATAREFPQIGKIAGFLDEMPNAVRTPIFLFLWFVFLFGGPALLLWGVRGLIKARSK